MAIPAVAAAAGVPAAAMSGGTAATVGTAAGTSAGGTAAVSSTAWGGIASAGASASGSVGNESAASSGARTSQKSTAVVRAAAANARAHGSDVLELQDSAVRESWEIYEGQRVRVINFFDPEENDSASPANQAERGLKNPTSESSESSSPTKRERSQSERSTDLPASQANSSWALRASNNETSQTDAATKQLPRNDPNGRLTLGTQVGGAINDETKRIVGELMKIRKQLEDEVQDRGGMGRAIVGATIATVIDVVSGTIEDAGEAAEQIGSLGRSVGEKGIAGFGEEAKRLKFIAEKGLDLVTRGAVKNSTRIYEGAKSLARAKKKGSKQPSKKIESDQKQRAERPRRDIKPVYVSPKVREIAQHAKQRAKELKKAYPELFKGNEKYKGGQLVHRELKKDFERGRGPFRDTSGVAEHEYGISYLGDSGKPAARKADVIVNDDGRKSVIEYKLSAVHDPSTGELKTFGYNSETGRLEFGRTDQIADYEAGGSLLGEADNVDVYVVAYESGALYKFDVLLMSWLRVE